MSEHIIQQARAYHARPQLSADPSENFNLIEQALERVRDSKERMEGFCKPKGKKKKEARQLGEPTEEREGHASHVHRDSLAPKDAPKVYRSLISQPMTLCEARAELLAKVFDDLQKGKDALRNHLTPLDKAAEDSEAHALERYVKGTLASEGKAAITNYSGASISSDKERIPFNDYSKMEIAGRHFVYARLPPAFQAKLDFFYALMTGREVTVTETVKDKDGKDVKRERHLTMIDLGMSVARSTDARVARGAYIATFRDVGQLLYALYSEFEINEARRKRQIADETRKRLLIEAR